MIREIKVGAWCRKGTPGDRGDGETSIQGELGLTVCLRGMPARRKKHTTGGLAQESRKDGSCMFIDRQCQVAFGCKRLRASRRRGR